MTISKCQLLHGEVKINILVFLSIIPRPPARRLALAILRGWRENRAFFFFYQERSAVHPRLAAGPDRHLWVGAEELQSPIPKRRSKGQQISRSILGTPSSHIPSKFCFSLPTFLRAPRGCPSARSLSSHLPRSVVAGRGEPSGMRHRFSTQHLSNPEIRRFTTLPAQTPFHYPFQQTHKVCQRGSWNYQQESCRGAPQSPGSLRSVSRSRQLR